MKMRSVIALLLSVVTIIASFTLGSCTSQKPKIQLSYDDQIKEDNSFNNNLFYRNDLVIPVADPSVIHITDKDSSEYGYYYCYGTNSTTSFIAYRSKDLVTWENVSDLKGFPVFYPPDDNFAYDTLWAPEVIYDESDGKYYMFYSGNNRYKQDVDSWAVMIGLAVADEPYGPFVPYVDATHNAKTTLFDDEKIMAAARRTLPDAGPLWTCIDPHPFVAPDGTKYLIFTADRAGKYQKTQIWGIKMKSWGEPDYDTLTQLTKTGYYTVDGEEINPAEGKNNNINEGSFIYIHKKSDGTYRYILVLSINSYRDKSYCVIQAVADNPLGPYRKLTEEEGGIILSTDHMSWDFISGPGHNSFIRVGDEMFIVYHAHIDREKGGSERAIAIDRVCITTNDKGEEVLYVNGPTWSLQPRPVLYSDYKNIASDAKVSATNGSNVEALTDGLLSLYKQSFVKEFETDKTTTITLDFGDYREITGLMIYNSKNYEKAFPEVTNIEFDFVNDELPNGAIAYINNLKFNWKMYKNEYADEMRPGGSAVAIFNPLKVKQIRITFKLPMTRPEDIQLMDDQGYIIDQTSVALSEIVVLGK
ncbi:MAG: family 43 glycosylhydrolase [Clostridiaceae bacterium]|nr:family 43 glycosylhydrolase [Clostridiaceae bacterium]